MNETYVIVAMTKNRVIGKNGKMPWHITDDLKLFKKLTTGGTIIMGRKTFESIGKPLPDRENIIISSGMAEPYGCRVFDSVLLALRYASATGKKVFFIGGGELYKKVINIANNIYVSVIKQEYDGDTYFPEIKEDEWQEVESVDYPDFIWKHYKRV